MRNCSLLLAVVAVGCSQPPSKTNGNNGQTGGNGVYLLSGVDEPCDDEPDLTAAEVLTNVADRYEATLRYSDETTTPLRLELRYENGALTCNPRIDPTMGSDEQSYPAYIDIEVAVRFETDDEAFQEQFDGLVSGGGEAGGAIGATWMGSMHYDSLNGSFAPDALAEFGPNPNVSFSGNLSPDSSDGTVMLGESGRSTQVGGWAE